VAKWTACLACCLGDKAFLAFVSRPETNHQPGAAHRVASTVEQEVANRVRDATRHGGGSQGRLADLVLIDGWTGLRWSELRAVRVRNFIEVPMPMLVVDRAEPEGVRVKTTKSDRSRRVQIADRVLPLIRACAEGRGPDERLFLTESGHRLHATAL
jgi:integrase